MPLLGPVALVSVERVGRVAIGVCRLHRIEGLDGHRSQGAKQRDHMCTAPWAAKELGELTAKTPSDRQTYELLEGGLDRWARQIRVSVEHDVDRLDLERRKADHQIDDHVVNVKWLGVISHVQPSGFGIGHLTAHAHVFCVDSV